MEKRTTLFLWAAMCLLAACLIPSRLNAQAITATVLGTITDPSGAAIPNATVSLRSTATNQVRETKTNEVGNYEFPFSPVGSYTLSVQAAGFQAAEVSAFQVSVEQVARVNVQLKVGEMSEKISVEAAAIGLQTEEATVGTVIDSQKVVELPLNGRSFVQLALLTPGVNPGTPGSITVRRSRGAVGQQVGMSANGARDTQNRFYYDGIEAMDLDSYSFSFSASIDAIQEFKVETSTYSADVGGAPGGQVNLMTKSGTAALHGTAWEFNRNDAFAALAPFQPFTAGAKPPRLNRNQFGANIGGPVYVPKIYPKKNDTFFFFNWESGRQISGSFGPTAFVPPLPYRTGDFSGSSVVIYDPETGQPFPRNIIPQDRIRNYAKKYLDTVPKPTTSEPSINYRGPRASAPITQDQYVSRLDHRFSDRNMLYGSYMFNTQADNTIPTFTYDTRGNRARAQNLSLTDTQILTTSTVNEVRLGWNRFFEHEFFGTTDNAALDLGNIMGIAGVSKRPRDFGPPAFGGAGYDLWTVRTNGPRDRLNQLWQVADNLTHRKGNHFFKAGVTIARRNWTFDEAVNPRGTFTYDGRTTSGGASPVRENGFASFLLGLATAANISAEPFATRMNNWWQAYFFQDDWKVSPQLTLNLGIRYEYFSPPLQRGPVTNFDLMGAVPGYVPSVQIYHGFPNIQDTAGYPASLVYPDRRDWGPRFGFAYSVPGMRDFVVRGGYGIYYTPEITNSYTTLTLNPPIVNAYDFAATFDKPVQVETAFSTQGQVKPSFGSGALDPHLRNTYNQQWNFTIQKKLPANLYVDLGYVGSKGTRLTKYYDSNRPLAVVTPGPATPPIASRRPFPGFGAINAVKAIGNSTYNSLQLKVERRVSRGLSVLSAYTWSKSLSDADISSVGGGSYLAGVQDYMNPAADRSPSVYDIPHRLSLAAIYDVPWFAGARAPVRALLGGWQIGTIVTEQSGFASSIGGAGDTTGTGVGSRLTMVAGQKAQLPRSQRSREKWFNTAAFMLTPLGRFGDALREPIHLPGLNQVDFSATKNFRFTESHTLQFRAEFFNFFNHVNLGAPGLSIQAPDSFGRITSSSQTAGVANEARIIQFGLKYRF